MASIGHEYVGRLDVPMDDSLAVGGVERVRNLDPEVQHLLQRHPLAVDMSFQRHTVQILHGNESLPVLIVNLVDGADVAMVQCGCGFGFSLEALNACGSLAANREEI